LAIHLNNDAFRLLQFMPLMHAGEAGVLPDGTQIALMKLLLASRFTAAALYPRIEPAQALAIAKASHPGRTNLDISASVIDLKRPVLFIRLRHGALWCLDGYKRIELAFSRGLDVIPMVEFSEDDARKCQVYEPVIPEDPQLDTWTARGVKVLRAKSSKLSPVPAQSNARSLGRPYFVPVFHYLPDREAEGFARKGRPPKSSFRDAIDRAIGRAIAVAQAKLRDVRRPGVAAGLIEAVHGWHLATRDGRIINLVCIPHPRDLERLVAAERTDAWMAPALLGSQLALRHGKEEIVCAICRELAASLADLGAARRRAQEIETQDSALARDAERGAKIDNFRLFERVVGDETVRFPDRRGDFTQALMNPVAFAANSGIGAWQLWADFMYLHGLLTLAAYARLSLHPDEAESGKVEIDPMTAIGLGQFLARGLVKQPQYTDGHWRFALHIIEILGLIPRLRAEFEQSITEVLDDFMRRGWPLEIEAI
jgi:hypothetical protein